MTKKYLKDKVLDLLRYSEVLLTTMTEELRELMPMLMKCWV